MMFGVWLIWLVSVISGSVIVRLKIRLLSFELLW